MHDTGTEFVRRSGSMMLSWSISMAIAAVAIAISMTMEAIGVLRISSHDCEVKVLQEDSDYVNLLQDAYLRVQFPYEGNKVTPGATELVIDSTGTNGVGALPVTTPQPAASNSHIEDASTGLVAQPTPHTDVVSFVESVVRVDSLGKTAMSISDSVHRFRIAATSGSSWAIIMSTITFVILSMLLCVFSATQSGDAIQGDLFQRQRLASASSAKGADGAPPQCCQDELSFRPASSSLTSQRQGRPTPRPSIAERPSLRDYQKPAKRTADAPDVARQPPDLGEPPESLLTPRLQTVRPASDMGQRPRLIGSSSILPPPLCPTLLLPSCDARFVVPVDALSEVRTEGALDIMGVSGNPLLRVVVHQVNGGDRALMVSMPPPLNSTRVRIGPPATGSRADQGLEIRRFDHELYGELVLQPNGQYDVVKDGRTAMVLGDQMGNALLMVSTVDGQALAHVTCGSESFGSVRSLEVRVHPNVDAVLVLSCVLSVILLF